MCLKKLIINGVCVGGAFKYPEQYLHFTLSGEGKAFYVRICT